MGGGTRKVRFALALQKGLSPRGRGNHRQPDSDPPRKRSIPAWAGEPVARYSGDGFNTVYPRVGGGTMNTLNNQVAQTGLSPRGRGNPPGSAGAAAAGGSIPAWAGEPAAGAAPTASGGVYPRVGGGTTSTRRTWPTRSGLSPRGRGNPLTLNNPNGDRGSIPAWAGEPR